MATRPEPMPGSWSASVRRGAARSGAMLGGIGLGLCGLALVLALASYKPSDRALNTSAASASGNLLGDFGAWLADILLSSFGPAICLLVPLALVAAVRMWRGVSLAGAGGRVAGSLFGIALIGLALGLFRPESYPGLPGGLGGIIGFVGASITSWVINLIPMEGAEALVRWLSIAAFGLAGSTRRRWNAMRDTLPRIGAR
jgi:S-DNA-T family DNA segregation ATPase FtsK/SpoIIIE